MFRVCMMALAIFWLLDWPLGFSPAMANDGPAGSYIALAVVPGQGRLHHGISKRTSADMAQKSALSQCGDRKCLVVQIYGQLQCAHIILGDTQIWWNNLRFDRSESSSVMDVCRSEDKNCHTLLSDCPPIT